jgi:hypothetical protein
MPEPHTVQPLCCPDAYTCYSGEQPELECPRHGGFDVCCNQPEAHVPQSREAWHRQMERWEQSLLDEHIRWYLALKVMPPTSLVPLNFSS